MRKLITCEPRQPGAIIQPLRVRDYVAFVGFGMVALYGLLFFAHMFGG